MQLDLFLDGREALLINDLVAKLLERKPADSEEALDRLRQESPQHPDLAAFDRLVRSLQAGPRPPLGTDELGAMIESLAALVPAAERLLGRGAPAFLRPWWQALARTEAVPAPAEPAPLVRFWIGSGRCNVGDDREAFRLWLPLCWLEPESFARQAPTFPNRIVRESWAMFDADADREESGDARAREVPWFPAWLALQHRWVAHLFRPDEVPETGAPLRALRLLPGLLALEGRGYSPELVQQRRALRDISPTFFRRYWQLVVKTRGPAT